MVEYSCSVWDPHLEKDIHNIEIIQRGGARFVAQNYGRQSSVHNMINDLNRSPLELRRREARLTMFYKIINDLIAIPAEDYVTHASGNNFRPITSNTNVFANSFLNSHTALMVPDCYLAVHFTQNLVSSNTIF